MRVWTEYWYGYPPWSALSLERVAIVIPSRSMTSVEPVQPIPYSRPVLNMKEKAMGQHFDLYV